MLIFKGSPFQFACLITLLSFLGLCEFYRMALPGRKPEGWLAAIVGACLTPLPLCLSACGTDWFLCVLTGAVLAFAIMFLFRIGDIRSVAQEFALLAAGFLYVPLLMAHLILLRYQPHGSQWIILLMAVVMAGDSSAYYVGCNLGKRKLYPVVSPNKSVEGALGGLAGSMAGAFFTRALFFPELTPVDCVATALILGVFGQLGDLFESLLKRSFGVKDSGTIIPGHGGVLDRLDSILFAAPVLFYYARFFFMYR